MRYLFLFFVSLSFNSFSQDVWALEVSQSSTTSLEFYATVRMLTVTTVVSEEVLVENQNITIDVCYNKSFFDLEDIKVHDITIPISEDFSEYTLNFRVFVFQDPETECDFNNPNYDETFEIETPIDGTITLDVNSVELEKSISIYPNPIENIFLLDFPFNDTTKLLLLDLNGRNIKRLPNSRKQNISNLRSGVYFLKVFHNAKRYITKIIKR